MNQPVRVVLFDVNETLSDLSALAPLFEEVGAPSGLLPTWFASVLRDGFALTAAGGYADFREVAEEALRALLPAVDGLREEPAAAAARILAGFSDLPVHPDVAPGVRRLGAAGLRLATLTNGAAANTERLLERAGLRGCFEALLDVAGPCAWKPAARAYRYATERLGVRPEEVLLVAVHPWDVDGASRAGLGTAWLRRGATHYPATMAAPVYAADDLAALADRLAGPPVTAQDR